MFLSHAQNGEDVMLWRALREVSHGFYIDVGAADPDVDSVTKAFYDRGWRGVNIEPLAQVQPLFRRERPFDITLQLALAAAPGEAQFYEVANTGLSTLDPAIAMAHRASGHTVTPETVKVSTLRQVCERHAPAEIHFLKIDCEGAEGAVLQGADFTRHRPWIVLAEATVPNSQEPSYQDWEPLLLAADYRFVWFDGLNRFYVSAERHQALREHFQIPINVFDEVRRAPPPRRLQQPPATDEPDVFVPPVASDEDRIEITLRCRDCDDIAKVADAGMVREEPDGERVQIMHNGLKVPADGYCGAWMTRLIELARGHHEPQEERLFHELIGRLPAEATMLELGGWWSYYSAWFLKDAPRRRAVILEPDPAHRAVGERTMALNGLTAEFLSGVAARTPAAPSPFQTEVSGALPLPRLNVPQILEERGIHTLDLLHCDTQGAELDVLLSCRELFEAGRIGWVFVSTHAHTISGDPLTHQRCLAAIGEAGGLVEAEHDVHESFSGDGLIVARFGPAPDGWAAPLISYNRYSKSLFRNPLYDLAEAQRRSPERETAEAVIKALYRNLLLRPADPGGLRDHTDFALRTGDFDGLMTRFLRSRGFRGGWAEFSERYFNQRAIGFGRYLATPGPLETSGLRLTLTQDGPLGRAGETVLSPTDQVILPHLFTKGSWEGDWTQAIIEHLRPGTDYALIDIGANIGLFTRQLFTACDRVRAAVCVEPDPENFRALGFNLSGLDDRDVRLFNLALGSAEATARFYRDRDNFGNYSLLRAAMRGHAFETGSVEVSPAGTWLAEAVPAEGRLIWKSDTQGSDEVIIGHAPWPVWERVDVAMIELWRIDKPGQDRGDFLDKVESFPHRKLGAVEAATTQDVAAYLASRDRQHLDLLLWR